MTEATARSAAADALPARWRERERFVVLDTGFFDAGRFLACWHRWRGGEPAPLPARGRLSDTLQRCRLHVILLVARLPSREELQARWARSAVPRDETGCSTRAMIEAELLAAWPPAVPGLHRLGFEGGQVQLLLAAGGSVRDWLAQLAARVDAFFVDADALVGDGDADWPLRLFKAAARLAAPDATLTMPAAGDAARAALRSAGFALSNGNEAAARLANAAEAASNAAIWHARHAPAFTARRPLNRPAVAAGSAPPAERHAWIVGAGLAGCATAWALAERGWHSTLVDRHDAPAQEASGNPAGLFHGVVHPQDGAHARFNRAAALEASRAVRTAIDEHGVAGEVGGLLRLQTSTPDQPAGATPMEHTLRNAGLPADYVCIVDAEQASALAGMPIAHPCWHFPGGGWVQPAGLARAFFERAGTSARFVGGVTVASLRRIDGAAPTGDAVVGGARAAPSPLPDPAAAGTRWQLVDRGGQLIGEPAVVVLAHAGDASALIAPHAAAGTSNAPAPPPSPLQSVRGQLSLLPIAELPRALPGLVLPRLPVVGSGWLLPAVDGLAVFGATAQPGDHDPAVRTSDHAANVAALARLTGLRFADGEPPEPLRGRTAWRCVAADRLPLIGAVPSGATDDGPGRQRAELIPRLPGLYTFSALGSRGITWAALGAQVLASLIAGGPVPLTRGLIEAVDPGRFLLRARRRQRPPR